MRCEDLAERLTDFMEGDLSELEQAAALEHLASCDQCEAVLSQTRAAADLAQSHGRVELTEDDRRRMFRAVLD